MRRSIAWIPLLLLAVAVGSLLLAACTSTPADFPPCVNPYAPACPPYDAGIDASATDADGANDSP